MNINSLALPPRDRASCNAVRPPCKKEINNNNIHYTDMHMLEQYANNYEDYENIFTGNFGFTM